MSSPMRTMSAKGGEVKVRKCCSQLLLLSVHSLLLTEGKVLELESMMTEAMSKLEEEPDTGVSLNLNNLIVINEYCKSLIKGVDKDR